MKGLMVAMVMVVVGDDDCDEGETVAYVGG